jgi:hypothetical protein
MRCKASWWSIQTTKHTVKDAIEIPESTLPTDRNLQPERIMFDTYLRSLFSSTNEPSPGFSEAINGHLQGVAFNLSFGYGDGVYFSHESRQRLSLEVYLSKYE